MRQNPHGGDIYTKKCRVDFSVNVNPLGAPESVKEAVRKSAESVEQYPEVMAPIMAAIAHNFICYGYTEEEPAPYLSDGWEVYFWCNDFSNTAHGCGLSGRDYSYFTLTFNERQTVSQRRVLCERLLEFLDTEFKSHPNLHVAVQYSTW